MVMRAPVALGSAGTFWFRSQIDARYTVGRDPAVRAVRQLIEQEPYVAVDIETSGVGVKAMDLKVVSIGSAAHAVVLDPRDPPQADAIRWALHTARVLVVHNSPFDVPILVRHGLMSLADIAKVMDTLVYCRLAEPDERTSKSLIAAGNRYLGIDTADVLGVAFKALRMSKTAGFECFDLDRPIYVQGAAFDVVLTARLLPLVRQAAYQRLTVGHPFAAYGVSGVEADALVEREQILNRIFLRRSARGLRVDLEFLDRYRTAVAAQQEQDRVVLEEVGVKPGNGASLTTWLDAHGLLPDTHPRTAKTHAPAATKQALARLGHPVAVALAG